MADEQKGGQSREKGGQKGDTDKKESGEKKESFALKSWDDVVKVATEHVSPFLTSLVVSRVPGDTAKYAWLFGPLTSLALLRAVPDKGRFTKGIEDFITAFVRDMGKALRDEDKRRVAEAAEKAGVSISLLSGLFVRNLATISTFYETLNEEHQKVAKEFLTTAKPEALQAWLEKADHEKLRDLDAMLTLQGKRGRTFDDLMLDPAIDAGARTIFLREYREPALSPADRHAIDTYTKTIDTVAEANTFMSLPMDERIALAMRYRSSDRTAQVTAGLHTAGARLRSWAERIDGAR